MIFGMLDHDSGQVQVELFDLFSEVAQESETLLCCCRKVLVWDRVVVVDMICICWLLWLLLFAFDGVVVTVCIAGCWVCYCLCLT